MRNNLKGFVLGVIITTMLMSTALGIGVKKTIEVAFNSVNLTVNGKKVQADTILYEGTTYVPLRAAGEILGKDVGWDKATNTASINDKGVAKPEPKEVGKETLSQQNAVKAAKKYLDYTAFSRKGLINQLEFEKYSKEDATYAANKVNADWNDQAIKKAKKYLEYTSFSKDGLIKQLEFDGFTNEEAAYAVKEIGL